MYESTLVKAEMDLFILVIFEALKKIIQVSIISTRVVLYGIISVSRKGIIPQGWLVLYLDFWNLVHVFAHSYKYFWRYGNVIYWLVVDYIMDVPVWLSNSCQSSRTRFIIWRGTKNLYSRLGSRFNLWVGDLKWICFWLYIFEIYPLVIGLFDFF